MVFFCREKFFINRLRLFSCRCWWSVIKPSVCSHHQPLMISSICLWYLLEICWHGLESSSGCWCFLLCQLACWMANAANANSIPGVEGSDLYAITVGFSFMFQQHKVTSLEFWFGVGVSNMGGMGLLQERTGGSASAQPVHKPLFTTT